MILGFTIFLATLNIDLYTDLKRFREGKRVNHLIGAALRLIGLIPACYYLGWDSIPLVLFAYWILFNGLYNLGIDQDWEFLGTTSTLDQLQRKFPVLKKVKYAGFVASVLIYIL